MIDLKKIGTEQRNPRTMNIDTVSTLEICKMINEEDKTVPYAVEKALPQIAALVDAIAEVIDNDGRLIYMGAGTSGRIGILDAAECPPTFSVSYETVQCLIAGGSTAFIKAVEGAEDSREFAVNDLKNINLTKADIVVGITASGRTPYAVAGVEYAKSIGCKTGCITTSPNSEIASKVDYPIEAITGSEPITGSTRMKSGTAQKLICNMLSTASMIKLGKVYGNLMIDFQLTNEKLIKRGQNMVSEATGVSFEEAQKYIDKFGTVKKSIFAILSGIENKEEVERILNEHKGHLRNALKAVK
ncbi:MAG TPA: N-acetylmuramic acid 6-phosphate etherase [Acholeplasmataceae bacterium]|jgi:N-acetylmuramic acid 6-phosphate etherase|nr:N-acetylmuramic acid 6-phosphate etherase [Acholeplasmataceae bacterium]